MARYRVGESEVRTMVANVTEIGSAKSRIRIGDSGRNSSIDREERIPDHRTALRAVLAWLESQKIDGVGHRVVVADHRCVRPQLITESVLTTLKQLRELAPDHMPQVIDAIQTVASLYPNVPQAACFDSAFHSRMPRTSQLFALPCRYFEEGVYRYGFHGLSCEFIMTELNAVDPAAAGRVIICAIWLLASPRTPVVRKL
jgi:acetate kinase